MSADIPNNSKFAQTPWDDEKKSERINRSIWYSRSWKFLEGVMSKTTWSWPNWLPNGYVTLLVSAVGLGKSTLALRLAASFLTGIDWPDGTPFIGDTGQVIWCESESSQTMNIERAMRWQLPTENILYPLADPSLPFNLSDEQHRKCLDEMVYDDYVRFIIFDSLRGAAKGDENNSEYIRQIQHIGYIASNSQKPVLVIHHCRKKSLFSLSDIPDIDSIRGSSAIAQLPRIIMAIDIPDPKQPDIRRLTEIKNSFGACPSPLGITITDHGIEVTSEPKPPVKVSQRNRAKDFLLENLRNGPQKSDDLYKLASEINIDSQTLKRAKKDLRILAFRKNNSWYWNPPNDLMGS